MRRPALVALLLAACAGSERVEPTPPPTCARNSDCDEGEVCYEDGCGSAVDFAVRVTPNSAQYVVQDFNPVSAAMSRMDLALQDPGILEGTLMSGVGDTTSAFDQKFYIEATGRSSAIPGLAFSQPLSATFSNGTRTGRYSLAVPPGTWQVRATPAAPSALPSGETPAVPILPPVIAERTVGSGGVVDPGLVLPGSGLYEISGRLTVSAGLPWPETSKVYFRFQALDPASSAPLSQPAIFLGGSLFHVYTATRSSSLVLRVGPDPKLSPEAIVPTKDFKPDAKGSFGAFELGAWGDPVEVSGTVLDPDGAPVAGAGLRAEGRVRGGGVWAQTGATDAAGRFLLRLLPSDPGDTVAPGAKYALTVRPPFDAAVASQTLQVAVGDRAVALPPITLPRKVLLKGRVLGPGAGGALEPLAEIPVVLEGNPASSERGRSVVSDLSTGLDGSWQALVEPGSYRVLAMPPASRKLPWGSQLVTAGGVDDEPPDVVLSDAREVFGRVVYRNKDGSETAVGSATVSIYRAPTSSTLQPLKIYEALTDSRGQFRAILPKAPSGEP